MLGLALLGLVSVGSAARNWVSVWRGLDELSITLQEVQVARDRSSVTVTTTISNDSEQTLQVHELFVGLRLTGRSLSAQDDRFDNLLLEPGDAFTFDSELEVTGEDAELLDERLAAGGERWNVTGRFSVAVDDLTEPVWFPFRFDADVN